MMKNILNTNKENFKEIYETNFNYVYSFVFLRLVANKEATEDIVQETFISAMKGLKNYKGTSSYKTWLCGIAKNKILNYYRNNIKKEGFAYVKELDFIEDNQYIEFMVINSETREVILETLLIHQMERNKEYIKDFLMTRINGIVVIYLVFHGFRKSF